MLEAEEEPTDPTPTGTSQAEIDEFDRELEKMIAEATYGASRETRQVNTDIRIPMNIHKQPSKLIFIHFW